MYPPKDMTDIVCSVCGRIEWAPIVYEDEHEILYFLPAPWKVDRKDKLYCKECKDE